MTDGWDFNPQTVSIAITALVLVVAVISARAAIVASRAATRTAQIVADESRLRTRPWVGLVDTELVFSSGTGLLPVDTLTFKYSDFGALPAHGLNFDITISPVILELAPGDSTVSQETSVSKQPITDSLSLGSLFPQEPGVYNMPFPGSSPFQVWRRIGFPISFSGRITYEADGNVYHTDF